VRLPAFFFSGGFLHMVCRTKQKNSELNPVPRLAWTINEVCAAYAISRSTYEKAKREGWGPREMGAGKAVRISDEARIEWVAVLEQRAAAKAKQKHRRREATKPKPQAEPVASPARTQRRRARTAAAMQRENA
jgi:hypothetical protein